MILEFKNLYRYDNLKSRLIVEGPTNLDNFIDLTKKCIAGMLRKQDHKSVLPVFEMKLKSDIEKSDTKGIYYAEFRQPALGFVTTNSVYINKMLLNSDCGDLLFTIFHELAHQHQYRKYGNDMTSLIYRSNSNIDVILDKILDIEYVADEFATRKLREYEKIPGLSTLSKRVHLAKKHKFIDKNQIKMMISQFKSVIDSYQFKSDEELTTMLYNSIVASLVE